MRTVTVYRLTIGVYYFGYYRTRKAALAAAQKARAMGYTDRPHIESWPVSSDDEARYLTGV